MAQAAEDEERAAQLAKEAALLAESGQSETASQKIREAVSISADNVDVKAAILRIGDHEQKHPLSGLCTRFVQGDEDAGKEATQLLRGYASELPSDTALSCIKLILAKENLTSPLQDPIIGNLVRLSAAVRHYFAAELGDSITRIFNNIYDRGDASTNCLDTIVLDKNSWSSEDVRTKCESDLLQLFVAKLMESGHDHDGRALKGISRLLGVDAEALASHIDEEGFDVILSSLDNRLPLDVRSQATLATAKYLEVSQEIGQKYLTDFITSRVKKQKSDDLIVAFSAAAAVFPIVPSAVATLFLTEGFLPSLIPLLHIKKSPKVDQAVIEMLNAACIEKACREAVAKYCNEWLSEKVSGSGGDRASLAAVVLTKTKAVPATQDASTTGIDDETYSVEELVDIFKGLMGSRIEGDKQNPIEGLAYASVKPEVKEALTNDPSFIKNLFRVMAERIQSPTLVFGGLTIIYNLTNFLPNLSEEQKKMSQLKAYANTSKMPEPEPLDDDEHVLKRCNLVIEAGCVPLLVECSKNSTPSARNLISQIFLSLSKSTKSRGILAQQGAVRLLLSDTYLKTGADTPVNRKASHALARILISVNPVHVFQASGFPQASSAVRPLIALLTVDADASPDQPRDLLPTFESLLALTNLASFPDGTAAQLILRLAWDTLEDLLLSNNTFIQRASCELVCNLMTIEEGVAKFADGSARAGQRLHILLALADVEDLATRRAAGGALAMLTEYDAAINAILQRKRGVEILLGLCQEEENDLIHRGITCIRNITCASGDIGKRGQEAVKENGGIDTLKGCLKRTSSPVILEIGVDALKPLVE